MPQVASSAIKERARRLRAAGAAALERRLASEVGATREVLIESDRQGRTEHYLPVTISGGRPGEVRRLAVTGYDDARLSVHEPIWPMP
jgi:threonylcarbamoyladenosine tRNA methylthiotransferase MtaB